MYRKSKQDSRSWGSCCERQQGTVVTPAPMEASGTGVIRGLRGAVNFHAVCPQDSTPSPERELATARLTGEKEG